MEEEKGISEEEIKKFERHMGKGQEITIGEDMFIFEPLLSDDLPTLLRLLSAFSKLKEGEEHKWVDMLDDKSSQQLVGLTKNMVKKSYPKLTDEQIDKFVSSNFVSLTTALFQINDLGSVKGRNVKEKIDHIRSIKAKKG